MELPPGCPRNVDAETSFRVIPFSITRKRILFSTSISHVSATVDLHSTSLPLVLVFPVAHPHPLTLLVCFGAGSDVCAICDLRLLEYHHEEHPFAFNRFDHERTADAALGE